VKKIILMAMVGCICLLSHYADAWDGICPKCKATRHQSRVYPGVCSSTLMFCGSGYYDINGNFVPPSECNKMTCSYSCSLGHSFTEEPKTELKSEVYHAVGKFNSYSTMR